MTAVENIGASAGRPRALRRDIGSHGNLRGKNRLDDIPHGVHQTARRIHFDDHQTSALGLSPANAAGDVVHGGRANGALDSKYQGRLR